MGKEARMKEIRKQLRNVVKEFLPDVFTEALSAKIRENLSERLGTRMDEIAKDCKDVLKVIDDRNKEFQGYVVRQLTSTVPVLDLPQQELPATETTKE